MPIKIQEAHRIPNRQNQKRNSPHHIIIKTLNAQNKERLLKVSRKKERIIYTGKPIRITPEFSMQTLKAKRAWINVL